MVKRVIRKSDFQVERRHVHLSSGEALAMLRELKGWTQQDLAEKSGIAVTNISNLENGRVSLGKQRAIILGKALGVHPAVLMFPDLSWITAA